VLTVSSRLGPYEIVGPLGAGGMGRVYRARDARLGREVAVKVLPEAFAGDPDRRARFEREARAVAALSHPNILAIHDYGTEGSVTYAVMELLEGQTVRGRLARGPLPWREAAEVAAAVADGLAAAHARGIVHRDLKPENLFLTADGRVKVLDFGLARTGAEPGSPDDQTVSYSPARTEVGAVMGTVGYMSPEQVRGEPADARSDLFALGCVLYEMVSGRRAFQRPTAAETMTAVLHEEPPDLSHLDAPVPGELGRLIRRCLAKSPSRRLHSARDLALALRAMAADSGPHPLAVTRPRRHALAAGAAAAAVLIGGVLVTSAYLRDRGPRPAAGPATRAGAATAVDAVAVLPFVYDGNDPKTELLSSTLAGHVIDSLGQVHRSELRIRPFSSVAGYRRQRPDVRTIGQKLNVPLVVTGTLHEQGRDLLITVEVVDAREDSLVWSKPYSSRSGATLDFDLQDRVVLDVAAHMGLRLTAEEERRATRRRTADPEAYRHYREAMFHLNKFTAQGMATAIESCEQAIARDPKYAIAYAGLARCYVLQGVAFVGPNQTFPEARKCVAEALRLDPDQADAHAALGAIYLLQDWKWKEAEQEFELALRLDPNVLATRNVYGFCLAVQGRLPEALASIRRGQELDPLTAARRIELAMCYNWMRQPDLAIAEANEAIKLDQNIALAYGELGSAYLQKGIHGEAIQAFGTAVELTRGHPRPRSMLACAYAAAGQRDKAQGELESLRSDRRYGCALAMARVHAALGERDEAFKLLREAVDERDTSLIWVKLDPTLDNLRADPRFAEVLAKIGLPP
jgi:serine/threonine protein kinase/tetratricopeptide (TPR) repeat protein